MKRIILNLSIFMGFLPIFFTSVYLNAEASDVNPKSTETKRIYFIHQNWSDPVQIKGNTLIRENNSDMAHIIKMDSQSITIQWPQYNSVETFLKRGNNLYIQDTLDYDKMLQEEYDLFEYSLKSPFIKINPYKNNPLLALIRFPTQKPAQFSFTIKGREGAPDYSHTFEGFRTEHIYPIFGLFSKWTNEVILKARYQDGTTETASIQIKIPARPNEVYLTPLTKSDSKNFFYYDHYGSIYDEYGFIRFRFQSPDILYWRDNLLIAEKTHLGLTLFTQEGKPVNHLFYPNHFYSFKHGINRMGNGHFLVIGSFEGSTAVVEGTEQPTHRDFIIELDDKTGKLIKQWDLAKILNPDRSTIVRSGARDYDKIDWTHTNSVQYNSNDHSILISGRHIGMAKIDYESGDLRWVMGPRTDYDKSGRDGKGPPIWDKVLTAVDKNGNPYEEAVQKGYKELSDFRWPIKTHDAKYLGGTLYSILDNGGEVYDKNIPKRPFSRGVIYSIDEDKKTIRQVISFDTDQISFAGSNITLLPDQKDIILYLSQAHDKNTAFTYGLLYRIDAKTKEIKFKQKINLTHSRWLYKLEPVSFYETKSLIKY